jgi:hypothetical protein
VKILNRHSWLLARGGCLVILGALGEGLIAPYHKNQCVVKCHTVPGGLDRGISGSLVLTW